MHATLTKKLSQSSEMPLKLQEFPSYWPPTASKMSELSSSSVTPLFKTQLIGKMTSSSSSSSPFWEDKPTEIANNSLTSSSELICITHNHSNYINFSIFKLPFSLLILLIIFKKKNIKSSIQKNIIIFSPQLFIKKVLEY